MYFHLKMIMIIDLFQMSALLFAEICAEAGLPAGVFNVITGNGAMGQVLAEHPDVDKVGFTGSTGMVKNTN